MSAFLRLRFEAIQCALERPALATFSRPFALRTASNGSRGISRRALRAQAARKEGQRALGRAAGESFLPLVTQTPAAFFVVRMTRVSPRGFDDDNLAAAFKGVRDGVAKALRIDDRKPLVRYVPDEARGAPHESRLVITLHAEPRPVEEQPFDASDYERPPKLEPGADVLALLCPAAFQLRAKPNVRRPR